MLMTSCILCVYIKYIMGSFSMKGWEGGCGWMVVLFFSASIFSTLFLCRGVRTIHVYRRFRNGNLHCSDCLG